MNMKTKRTFVIIGGLILTGALSACSGESSIIYNKEEMNVSEVEDRLADLLEVENPDLDLEVDIYTETDD